MAKPTKLIPVSIVRKKLASADYWETKARLLDFQRREQQLRLAIAKHAEAYNAFWRATFSRIGLDPANSQVAFLDETCEVTQTKDPR